MPAALLEVGVDHVLDQRLQVPGLVGDRLPVGLAALAVPHGPDGGARRVDGHLGPGQAVVADRGLFPIALDRRRHGAGFVRTFPGPKIGIEICSLYLCV